MPETVVGWTFCVHGDAILPSSSASLSCPSWPHDSLGSTADREVLSCPVLAGGRGRAESPLSGDCLASEFSVSCLDVLLALAAAADGDRCPLAGFDRRVGVAGGSRDLPASTSGGDLALTSGCLVATPTSRDLTPFGDEVTARLAGDLFAAGLLAFLMWVNRSAPCRVGLQRFNGCGSCECNFSID